MTEGIPEPSDGAMHIVKVVHFAECSDCGGQIWMRVWGEGVD